MDLVRFRPGRLGREVRRGAPFSEARANLGQLVERVAYSGGPVLIAKHERARVAVVPLDMLARDEARFRAAAERALTRRGAARQPASDEVDFEDVPGLGEADLAAERVKIDLLARNEDVCDRGPAGRRVHQPARSPWPISSEMPQATLLTMVVVAVAHPNQLSNGTERRCPKNDCRSAAYEFRTDFGES